MPAIRAAARFRLSAWVADAATNDPLDDLGCLPDRRIGKQARKGLERSCAGSAAFPPPERFCETFAAQAPPFPLVGKGMGMGGERLGARRLVEAGRPGSGRIGSDFPPPTPAPPHKGEGFAPNASRKGPDKRSRALRPGAG